MGGFPTLDVLPKDDRLWRLVWLGPFLDNEAEDRRITATFSRVQDPESAEDGRDLYDGSNNERLTQTFDYGFLPFLEIGSLWLNGRVLERSRLEEIDFTVDSDFSAMISVGDLPRKSTFLQGYDLLSYVCKFDIRTKQVGTTGLNFMLLPCIEIFRFYYGGGSSRLCRALLDGKYFQSKRNIALQFGIRPDNSQFVMLAPKIYDGDAINVARLCNDKIAEHNMISAFATGLFSRGVWSLQIGLPFRGETVLKIAGKHVTLGNDAKAFLGFRIIQCNKDYPLVYILKEQQIEDTDAGRSSPSGAGVLPQRKRMRKVLHKLSSIGDAASVSYDIEATEFSSFISSTRFTAALTMTSPVQTTDSLERFTMQIDDEIKAIAVANRSGKSNVGQAGFAPLPGELKLPIRPEGLDAFERALRFLPHVAHKSRITLEVLRHERRLFTDPKNPWSRINGSPRQCTIAKVRLLGRDCYVYECEPAIPALPASKAGAHPIQVFYANEGSAADGNGDFDEPLVSEEIANCEKSFGIVDDSIVGRIIRFKIKHPPYGSDGFAFSVAARIFERLYHALKKPEL